MPELASDKKTAWHILLAWLHVMEIKSFNPSDAFLLSSQEPSYSCFIHEIDQQVVKRAHLHSSLCLQRNGAF